MCWTIWRVPDWMLFFPETPCIHSRVKFTLSHLQNWKPPKSLLRKRQGVPDWIICFREQATCMFRSQIVLKSSKFGTLSAHPLEYRMGFQTPMTPPPPGYGTEHLRLSASNQQDRTQTSSVRGQCHIYQFCCISNWAAVDGWLNQTLLNSPKSWWVLHTVYQVQPEGHLTNIILQYLTHIIFQLLLSDVYDRLNEEGQRGYFLSYGHLIVWWQHDQPV